MSDFVHLHTHSYYSFLNGVPSPQALVDAAVENDMPALALTDHHGLTGAVEFYEACKKAKIQPILGIQLAIRHKFGKGSLILLAQNNQGWSNLCQLSSAVQSAPHRDPLQGVTFDFLANHTQGLICLSGGKRGLIGSLLEINQTDSAVQVLADLKTTFPNHLYVELQSQRPGDIHSIRSFVEMAKYLELPLVASNNVHYLTISEAGLQRTLTAMRLNTPLDALPADVPAPAGSEFCSSQQMAEKFSKYPSALENTFEITKRCQFELPSGKASLSKN